MNKQIKRFLACVLIVSLSIISLTPVSAAKAFSGTVAPFYNNVASATASININSSGKLQSDTNIPVTLRSQPKLLLRLILRKRYWVCFGKESISE